MEFRQKLKDDFIGKDLVSSRSLIFTDSYLLPSYEIVSDEAKKSLLIDNAGGKSTVSEMYSIDYFVKIHSAKDCIFEKEVQYWIDYKMVDFICEIDGCRIGVSVARAMEYLPRSPFDKNRAEKLLFKKLYGLIVARNSVMKSQSFYKSILHIWCENHTIAGLLFEAFENLDNNHYGLKVKGIVLLQLTVCEDRQLYENYIE